LQPRPYNRSHSIMNRNFFKIIFFYVLFLVFGLGPTKTMDGYAQNQKIKDLEQLDFANGLFERGMFEMSLEEYKKFIIVFSDSQYFEEAHFGIAESLFFSEDYKKAILAYQEYVKTFPLKDKVVFARLRLGQAFFFTQQYDRAVSIFERIKPVDLNASLLQSFYFYKARVLFERAQKDEA